MAHDHFYGICENKCLVEIEHDNIPGVVPVEKGGTGATTAANAISNLGAAAASHNHSAANITSGTLAIARGGTGATSADDARSNLGAAAASHNHSAANITSGTLAVARGGTGATSASSARSKLGVTGTSLYNNTAGTTGTITLSKSAADFSYLVFYYRYDAGGVWSSTKVYSPNGNQVALVGEDLSEDGSGHAFFKLSLYKVSGTSCTLKAKSQVSFSSSCKWGDNTGVRVIRVEGWNI